MATFSVKVNGTIWQELTQNEVLVVNKSSYIIKLHTGNTNPPLTTKDFIPLAPCESLTFEPASGEGLYALSDGGIAEVVYSDDAIVFTDSLLQEDSFLILQENNDKILIEV